MTKKNDIIVGLVLSILLLFTIFSGCLDFLNLYDDTVIYETHPTKVRYDIEYGYVVICSGTGDYNIIYDCDKPELLLGSISYDLLYKNQYSEVTLANNEIINWNINGTDDEDFKLGIDASVECDSYLVSDLNGNNALTLQEIKTQYPNLVDQYCNKQVVNNTAYIDPDNPTIKSMAQSIYDQASTNNAFLLAKEIFIWLKENTAYDTHIENNNVQPASTTYQCKTGDCDDLSFLYISLCRSLDIPARFIRGILVEESSTVSHAWAEVFVGGNIEGSGWLPVECAGSASKVETEVHQNFGVEGAEHLRLYTDDGSNESMNLSISGPKVYYDVGLDVDMTAFIEIENYEILKSEELSVIENYRSYS